MRIVDIIEKKKIGKELTKEEIFFFVNGFTSGEIKDYQASAFAMAIYFQGMNNDEIAILTDAMMHSGKTIDLSNVDGIPADKHSTGGVGDKVSIIVAPIFAALGGKLPKMSGKGLGFTGGTIDKLCSIKDFNASYSIEEFVAKTNKVGCAIVNQTDELAPADKKLYSLRDVTATVNSKALIASSIMSKKLATGTETILLDVKFGSGAFLKSLDEAVELAEIMIQIGKAFNKDIKAEITSMKRPLGRAIGNKNEVLEAIQFLEGKPVSPDLYEVITHSVVVMLMQSKIYNNEVEALTAVKEVISNGNALNKFKEWISEQEGDVENLFSPDFWNPKFSQDVIAKKDGVFVIESAADFGLAAMKLGAGRAKKEDEIDNEAGINLKAKTNDTVKKGDVLFTLYSSNPIPNEVESDLEESFVISEDKVDNPIIVQTLD